MLDIQTQFASQLPLAVVMDPKPLSPTVSALLAPHFTVVWCSSLPLTLQALAQEQPVVMIVSSRFAPTKLIRAFEALKERSTQALIPLIISLDLTQPTITLPSTRWAGKLGIITVDTSPNEFAALVHRLLSH